MLTRFAQVLLKLRPLYVLAAATILGLLAVCSTVAYAQSSEGAPAPPWALYLALGTLLVNLIFHAGMYRAVVGTLGKTVGEHEACIKDPDHGLAVRMSVMEATAVTQEQCRAIHQAPGGPRGK